MTGCRFRTRSSWDDTLPARHFGGPTIPPPPPMPKIEIPPMPEFNFEMPAFPEAPNLEAIETKRKLEEARQSELTQERKRKGYSSTILNRGGAAGLEDEARVQRPGLLAR
jgi:hypothetical protein